MNDIRSEPIESLRLVSDSDFEFAQYAMTERIQHHYTLQRTAENEALPDDIASKTSVYGATMLSGILYCAHCGHKLVGTYCTKQRANGAYHRPIYRCFNGAVKAKNCGGQTVYSAKKIEDAVLQVVHQYFSGFQRSVDTVWKERTRKQLKNTQAMKLKAAEAEVERLQKQEGILRQEVMKSLMGESSYDTELLKSMLEENKLALAGAESMLADCRQEKESSDAQLKRLSEQYDHIVDWAKEFDAADNDAKKMILAKLIERIEVDRDYHLTIKFFISLQDFVQKEDGKVVPLPGVNLQNLAG